MKIRELIEDLQMFNPEAEIETRQGTFTVALPTSEQVLVAAVALQVTKELREMQVQVLHYATDLERSAQRDRRRWRRIMLNHVGGLRDAAAMMALAPPRFEHYAKYGR